MSELFYHATPTEHVEAILEHGLWARRVPPKTQWRCSGVYAAPDLLTSRRWAQEIVNKIGKDCEMTILSFPHPGGFSIRSFGRGVGEQIHFRADVPASSISIVEEFFMAVDGEAVYQGRQWA